MNPYDFVRLDWSRPPERRPFTPQDRFIGLTGHIEGRIIAETPIFLPNKRNPRQFQTNLANTPIVSGSSLKGLFRCLVETLAPGCWWLFDAQYEWNRDTRTHDVDYSDRLPRAFAQCQDAGALCPSCRMFGLVQGRQVSLAGRVGFDDAVCTHAVKHASVFTPILDGPKPRHAAWYLDPAGRTVAGRKFYFHQGSIRTERELRRARSGKELNQQITPLDAGSVFQFAAHFTNLEPDELPLLLYVLTLEPTMRHKIGYAKPAGLGSVRVELSRLTLCDMAARYTGAPAQTYEADSLNQFIASRTDPFVSSRSSITLTDLRRIWGWPPNGSFQYPGQDWFSKNPKAPIGESP